MSSQLNVHDVKNIKVVLNRKVKHEADPEEFSFKTTDITIETYDGEVRIVLFGSREDIPISIEKEEQ